MRSTGQVGKELLCQFTLLHKEAGPETPEISAFYPHRRDRTVLFVIQSSWSTPTIMEKPYFGMTL